MVNPHPYPDNSGYDAQRPGAPADRPVPAPATRPPFAVLVVAVLLAASSVGLLYLTYLGITTMDRGRGAGSLAFGGCALLLVAGFGVLTAFTARSFVRTGNVAGAFLLGGAAVLLGLGAIANGLLRSGPEHRTGLLIGFSCVVAYGALLIGLPMLPSAERYLTERQTWFKTEHRRRPAARR